MNKHVVMCGRELRGAIDALEPGRGVYLRLTYAGYSYGAARWSKASAKKLCRQLELVSKKSMARDDSIAYVEITPDGDLLIKVILQ